MKVPDRVYHSPDTLENHFKDPIIILQSVIAGPIRSMWICFVIIVSYMVVFLLLLGTWSYRCRYPERRCLKPQDSDAGHVPSSVGHNESGLGVRAATNTTAAAWCVMKICYAS
jgi:hypothetical protein